MKVPKDFEKLFWSAKGYNFYGTDVKFGSVAEIIADTQEELIEIVGFPEDSVNYYIQFENFIPFDKIQLQLSRMTHEKVAKYLQSNPRILIEKLIEQKVLEYLNYQIDMLTVTLKVTEKELFERIQERELLFPKKIHKPMTEAYI